MIHSIKYHRPKRFVPLQPTRPRLRLIFIACFLVGLLMSQFAVGQVSDSIKLRLNVKIDSKGDAKAKYELQLPPRAFATLKQVMKDPFYVIRSMESNIGWLELANIDARFDNASCSVLSQCDAVGMMRTTDEGQWLLNVGNAKEGIELLDIRDGQAIFSCTSVSPTGLVRTYFTIETPRNSRNLAYDAKQGNLTYEYHPEIEEGGRTRTQFDLQAEERILSSLGKIYSQETKWTCFAAKTQFHQQR